MTGWGRAAGENATVLVGRRSRFRLGGRNDGLGAAVVLPHTCRLTVPPSRASGRTVSLVGRCGALGVRDERGRGDLAGHVRIFARQWVLAIAAESVEIGLQGFD